MRRSSAKCHKCFKVNKITKSKWFLSDHFSPVGELLLPLKDTVAFFLRRSCGSLHAALHQSIRKQPAGAVLCGVSLPLAPCRAGALCASGHLWWHLGRFLHSGKHCLVSTTQNDTPGPLPSLGGVGCDGTHSRVGFSQQLHAHEHQWAHFRAVQWLWLARLLSTVQLR